MPKFPLKVYPPTVRMMIESFAAYHTNPAIPHYYGASVLSALATCCGNAWLLRTQDGSKIAPVFWILVIGPSGTGKSPSMKKSLGPFRTQQETYTASFKEDWDDWNALDAKEQKEATKPVMKQVWISDTTIEAVAQTLEANRHGVVVHRGELMSWLGSFNKYSKGSGEKYDWMNLHDYESVSRNRVGQAPLYVPPSVVNILAGTTAAKLPKLVDSDGDSDGFLFRFLVTNPVSIRQKSKRGSTSAAMENYNQFMQTFYETGLNISEGGEPEFIRISRGGYRLLDKIEHERVKIQRTADKNGDEALSSIYSKLGDYLMKMVLVLHVAWCMDESGTVSKTVPVKTVEKAIKLYRYFVAENTKVFERILNPSPKDGLKGDKANWYKALCKLQLSLQASAPKTKKPYRGLTTQVMKAEGKKFDLSGRTVDRLIQDNTLFMFVSTGRYTTKF